MTTRPETASGQIHGDLAGAEDKICANCPHPSSSHDQIAARYCAATAASEQTGRGCVCSGK